MKALSGYVLSEEADKDIVSIFEFTFKEFGIKQANFYLTEMENLFFQLGKNPFIGKKRNELRKDLMSIVYDSHVIFYHIEKKQIRIVRVLHGCQDIPKQF